MANEAKTTQPPTSTYRSVVVTSFPFNPLTTAFEPPKECTGIYNPNVFMIDPMPSCLPPGHNQLDTVFFSPGYVCPSGYLTAKIDNRGVHSITTVTCCPYRSDIILSAVDPATLAGNWANLFCTWIAPHETTLQVTKSEKASTWTEPAAFKSPGGLNAYGIRMVYQQSDLPKQLKDGDKGAAANNTSQVVENAVDRPSGLSRAETIILATVLPIIVLAAVAGAFFIRWRKKQRYQKLHDPHFSKLSSSQPLDMIPAGNMSKAAKAGLHTPPPGVDEAHAYSHLENPFQDPRSTSAQTVAVDHYGPDSLPTYATYQPPSPEPQYLADFHDQSIPTPPDPPPPPHSAELSAGMVSRLTELPDDHRPSSGTHIDNQKILGRMPPR